MENKKIVIKYPPEKRSALSNLQWCSVDQRNVIEYMHNLKNFPFFGAAGEKISSSVHDFLNQRWKNYEKLKNPDFVLKTEDKFLLSRDSYHLKYWAVMDNRLDILEKYQDILFGLYSHDGRRLDSTKGGSYGVYSLDIYKQPLKEPQGGSNAPKATLSMLAMIHGNSDMVNFINKNEPSFNTQGTVDLSCFDLILTPVANVGVICKNTDMLFLYLKHNEIPHSYFKKEAIIQILEKAQSSNYKTELLEFILQKQYPHHDYEESMYKLCDKIKLVDSLNQDAINLTNKENKSFKL